MTMKFDTRDLELIRFIAEGGTLTCAANRMHVSQPAVSQRLANLQERVGAPLFSRKGGQMRTTEVGRRLLAASQTVDLELSSAMADVGRILDQQGNRLRVTTQCYTCYRWLPFVIRDMRMAWPSLNLDVVPDATDQPYEALTRGRIDLAIVSNPRSGYPFEEYALFDDELYAVMSKNHALAERRFLNPANFADQSLVLYTGDHHPILEEVLHPAGVMTARVVQVRITEAIVELARSGLGIAVLAGWAFNDLESRDGLKAVRITRRGFKRSWRAVVGESSTAEHVSGFVDCVRRIGRIVNEADWRQRAQTSARPVSTL